MIFEVEVGVDLAVPGVAAAAHGGHRRPARQVEAEFLLERLAELITFDFVEQRLEGSAEADLLDGKAAGREDFRIIGVDRGKRGRTDEAGHDQVLERLAHQGRIAEGVKSQISRHFFAQLSTEWAT